MSSALENAIRETCFKYGKPQVEEALKEAFLHGDFGFFTNTNNARNVLIARGIESFKEEFWQLYAKEIIKNNKKKHMSLDKVYFAKELYEDILEIVMIETYNKYKDSGKAEKIVADCLKEYYDTGNNRFTRNNKARAMLAFAEKNYLSPENLGDLQKRLFRIGHKKILAGIEERNNNINNVSIYKQNLKEIKEKMISGLTHDKEGSIALANMQATTNIGKVRTNQEDAVLLKIHPQNSNFKIMVVADGMGGEQYGEIASHKVTTEMSKWFETLPIEIFGDMKKLRIEMDKKILEIGREIFVEYGGKSGSTLVASIVGEKETLIANVGDSRAYIYKDGELTQVTKDQSYVQYLYDKGKIEQADDMRFHKDSHMITSGLGIESDESPKYTIIDNTKYDKLLLFSDGVTDCSSDKDILAITKNTPKNELAKVLVENAVEKNSTVRPKLNGKEEYEDILGGKDNATAAVLDNTVEGR